MNFSLEFFTNRFAVKHNLTGLDSLIKNKLCPSHKISLYLSEPNILAL